MNALTPKTALITGASVRVGREIALRLAASGWHIAVHYNNSKTEAEQLVKECEALGVKAACFAADLTDSTKTQALIPTIVETMGAVSLLVNNAAVFERDRIDNFTMEGWDFHHKTNLLAPLLLSQSFAQALPKGEEGHIINITDGCTGMCLSPEFLTYSLSKYGLNEATQMMAATFAPHIRVNAIAPGLTIPKEGEEEMFERLVKKLPLEKTSTPKEIAEAVSFLLETKSITGQILMLNGGANLYPALLNRK